MKAVVWRAFLLPLFAHWGCFSIRITQSKYSFCCKKTRKEISRHKYQLIMKIYTKKKHEQANFAQQRDNVSRMKLNTYCIQFKFALGLRLWKPCIVYQCGGEWVNLSVRLQSLAFLIRPGIYSTATSLQNEQNFI